MKTEGVQAAVRTIFSDKDSKAAFLRDPESAVSQLALSLEEKQALLNTHQRMGLISPNSRLLKEEVDSNSWWSSPVP